MKLLCNERNRSRITIVIYWTTIWPVCVDHNTPKQALMLHCPCRALVNHTVGTVTNLSKRFWNFSSKALNLLCVIFGTSCINLSSFCSRNVYSLIQPSPNRPIYIISGQTVIDLSNFFKRDQLLVMVVHWKTLINL